RCPSVRSRSIPWAPSPKPRTFSILIWATYMSVYPSADPHGFAPPQISTARRGRAGPAAARSPHHRRDPLAPHLLHPIAHRPHAAGERLQLLLRDRELWIVPRVDVRELQELEEAIVLRRAPRKHVAQERVQITGALAEVIEVVGLRLVRRQHQEGAVIEALCY